jgi:hypothetical protein
MSCCRKHDSYTVVGRDAWFVCDVHRLRWFASRDLRGDLTSNRPKGSLNGERVGAQRNVADYDVIEPVYPAHAHPLFHMHRDNKQAATVASKQRGDLYVRRHWSGRQAVPSKRNVPARVLGDGAR